MNSDSTAPILPIRAPEECPKGTIDPRWLQNDIDANIALSRAPLSPDGHALTKDEAQNILKHRISELQTDAGFACPIKCCVGRRPFATETQLVKHLTKVEGARKRKIRSGVDIQMGPANSEADLGVENLSVKRARIEGTNNINGGTKSRVNREAMVSPVLARSTILEDAI
ncbi:hypothetical protein EXIGLDRAFT_759313 [Exidia glandulosa HHB12029]|uniref:Uncharacterized protein n=1 Tax=Exidia glandulosa HHB12029 TaxID=1314781 RepID=A0A165Q2P6_EXIGL|nr:hypothetical protein EXIGLDRAFT_759313 [Exidia glandulosa HHB12029]